MINKKLIFLIIIIFLTCFNIKNACANDNDIYKAILNYVNSYDSLNTSELRFHAYKPFIPELFKYENQIGEYLKLNTAMLKSVCEIGTLMEEIAFLQKKYNSNINTSDPDAQKKNQEYLTLINEKKSMREQLKNKQYESRVKFEEGRKPLIEFFKKHSINFDWLDNLSTENYDLYNQIKINLNDSLIYKLLSNEENSDTYFNKFQKRHSEPHDDSLFNLARSLRDRDKNCNDIINSTARHLFITSHQKAALQLLILSINSLFEYESHLIKNDFIQSKGLHHTFYLLSELILLIAHCDLNEKEIIIISNFLEKLKLNYNIEALFDSKINHFNESISALHRMDLNKINELLKLSPEKFNFLNSFINKIENSRYAKITFQKYLIDAQNDLDNFIKYRVKLKKDETKKNFINKIDNYYMKNFQKYNFLFAIYSFCNFTHLDAEINLLEKINFLKTLLALKSFKIKNNRLPSQLSELYSEDNLIKPEKSPNFDREYNYIKTGKTAILYGGDLKSHLNENMLEKYNTFTEYSERIKAIFSIDGVYLIE